MNERSSELDEIEKGNLEKVISQVESAVADSTAGTRGILENCLRNARARLDTIDKRIKESVERERTQKADVMAMEAYQAEQEAALTAKERETYGGFLREEFFTKADFGKLENFYAHTWDRLSEQGKDAMSHRVWEGIRREQYTFAELPRAVREKEMERAYKRLTISELGREEIEHIPVKDRADFISAFEAGHKEDAATVLNRTSFREAMFKGGDSVPHSLVSAERGHESQRETINTRLNSNSAEKSVSAAATPQFGGKQDIDLTSVNLENLKIAESASPPAVSNMPGVQTSPGPNPQVSR